MAVIVQPFVVGDWAGVAFSADPVTGDQSTVVIEAGRTEGATVVSGHLTPELYHVTLAPDDGPPRVRRRAGTPPDPGVHHEHRGPSAGNRSHLELPEARVLELARLVKAVERAAETPIVAGRFGVRYIVGSR